VNTAGEALQRLDDLLLDSLRVRWTASERLRYLSDAQRQVMAFVPEAGPSGIATFTLTPGLARQSAPGGTAKLLDLLSVNGADVRAISLEEMDFQRPGWMREAANDRVQHWMPVTASQRDFLVYPRPKTAVQAEALLATWPAPLTNASDPLTVREDARQAIVHYAAAMCWMKDDTPGDRENAMTHMQLWVAGMQAVGASDTKALMSIFDNRRRAGA
jgi:hypothetical protein